MVKWCITMEAQGRQRFTEFIHFECMAEVPMGLMFSTTNVPSPAAVIYWVRSREKVNIEVDKVHKGDPLISYCGQQPSIHIWTVRTFKTQETAGHKTCEILSKIPQDNMQQPWS